MALTLMALSAWIAVVSAGRGSAVRTALLLLSGVVCALADATKYATALWTSIVIGLVVLLVWRQWGRGAGVAAGVVFTVGVALSIAIGLHMGGASYWQGIRLTTLSRQQGDASPVGVLYTSLGWVAVVLVLAVMGAIMTSGGGRGGPQASIAWLFVVAGVLAPLEQARIGTFTSLFKHVGYGGWFACAVAGFALAAFIQSVPAAKAGRAIAASLAIAVLAMGSGILLAGCHFQGWPTATSAVSYLKPMAGDGKILAGAIPVLEYYLTGVRWKNWQAINVNDDVSMFRGQILTGQYAAVVFDYVDTTPLDLKLRQLLAQSGRYQLARSFYVPQRLGPYTQYTVWTRIFEGADLTTQAKSAQRKTPGDMQPGPVLPVPPDDAEKYAYINRALPYLSTWLTAGFFFLVASQVITEYRIGAAVMLAPFTALYAVYQLMSLPINFSGRGFNLSAHRNKVVNWRPRRYPDVDIYLPICGEAPEILYNTWASVARLMNAYPGRANAYVLDDGADEIARHMAAQLEFGCTRSLQ